jgi:hypothetical protein
MNVKQQSRSFFIFGYYYVEEKNKSQFTGRDQKKASITTGFSKDSNFQSWLAGCTKK